RGSRPLIGGTIRGTQGSPVGAKVRTINVGTGLSRVYTIIRQQHNGNIRIDHGPEDCATVNIFLPLFR
ncbi:MAG TPA: hypothetical protein VMC85_11195, partial [Desulfomonilaceae bacterium]|nr:hypothetical protein [Desulfomonilaceae bacterium]